MNKVMEVHDPRFDPFEGWGIIDAMLDHSEKPAKELLDAGYGHGGGWHHFDGFTLRDDNSIKYPGDPAMKPLSTIHRGDEKIIMYPYSWVMIMQPDRSFEICRMD